MAGFLAATPRTLAAPVPGAKYRAERLPRERRRAARRVEARDPRARAYPLAVEKAHEVIAGRPILAVVLDLEDGQAARGARVALVKEVEGHVNCPAAGIHAQS